ncbi:uncharacterized protein OCT59_025301 [Rhizophagus irregularis]|uniref:uncharacterized protein n=1 Tax=Rhizophagus irregularis TaxID=588596 RepID=UPI003317D3E9|nr:hypothetical protein OCT59_025301 [Rhizophagus irregularis]
MVTQFFSKLSQNYIELLKDDEYYDITIEVGEDPNVKIFRAHKNILCYRSSYLRRILKSNKKNNDNVLTHIKLSNTSPEIFQIILEYIYGEIEVWEHVLKWGLAQNPTLILDPKTWSDDDFKTMSNTLQHCLPFVRFFCLSSKEFSQKVRPYQKLLNQQLYEDLLNFYLEPDSVSSQNVQVPRKIKINEKIEEVICSRIVNSGIVSTISRWIDKITIDDNNFNESYLPYKFELLLKGSRDGFTPKKFHELCDNRLKTVTFIKIKGTEEIIGGYNPVIWESSVIWGETKDSFIFSFKNKNNIKDAILSYIKISGHAIANHPEVGPKFGHDIIIGAQNAFTDYDVAQCKKHYYEKKIRDSEGEFIIEDYEVFQIIKK